MMSARRASLTLLSKISTTSKVPTRLSIKYIKINSLPSIRTYSKWPHHNAPLGPPVNNSGRSVKYASVVVASIVGITGFHSIGHVGEAKEQSPINVIEDSDDHEGAEKIDWKKRYKLGKRLGEGTFGVVYLVTDKKTKAKYAAKVLKKRKDQRYLELLANEIKIMEAAGKHPFIVSLVEKCENDSEVVLIMDLVTGGELFDRVCEVGRLSEKDASMMLRQVCEAIRHLHSRGICHNDVKPENLLLTTKSSNASLKLVDFGTSIFMTEPVLFDKPSGTAAYRSPETICHQPSERSIDMWAFGIVMYIMLCGAHPFDLSGDSPNAAILVRAIDPKLDSSKMWPRLSESARDLLARLLDPNPDTRISADQALNHPWLGGNAAPEELLPQVHMHSLRGNNARRKLRVAAMTIGTSAKTDMAMAKKFYTQDPDYEKACDRPDTKYMIDIEVYKDAFKVFDKDGDGAISSNELNEVFSAMGQTLTDQELRVLVAEADLNGDGIISIDEFIGMMTRRVVKARGTSEQEIRRVFEIFDRDKSGSIDKHELEYVLNEVLEQDCDDQLIEQMISEADLNNDGLIDYNEFVQYIFSKKV
eukprot:CFRG7900T1